jgi:hypothetical protein
LFSKKLHFSYGDDKGRGREDWQFQAERLPPDQLVRALKDYGFAAIYVNRKAYPDRAQGLLEGLHAATGSPIIDSHNRELAAIVLATMPTP